MYSNSRSRSQYTPLLGGNYDDNSSQASTEDGYQTGGLPFSLNADPSDLNVIIMSGSKDGTSGSVNDGGGLPRPITFADKELMINKPEKSPAPSTSFTESFETSLKSVSDYSGFHDAHPDFSYVSTVSASYWRVVVTAIQLCTYLGCVCVRVVKKLGHVRQCGNWVQAPVFMVNRATYKKLCLPKITCAPMHVTVQANKERS